MIRNKKAQFFVVFAVLIGVMILVATSQANKIQSNKNNEKTFYLFCENYKNEIFKISHYVINTGNKTNEINFVSDFTNQLKNNLEKNYEISMFYLYGNSSMIYITNYFGSKINLRNENDHQSSVNDSSTTTFYGHEITLTNATDETFIRVYNFDNFEQFYFYIKAQKDKEVYICE